MFTVSSRWGVFVVAPLIALNGCSDLHHPVSTDPLSAQQSVTPQLGEHWQLTEYDYGTLTGSRAGFNAVNDAGKPAGWVVDATTGMSHAVACDSYDPRSCMDLGTLPGGSRSEAIAIASCGWSCPPRRVAGNSQTATGDEHAVVWERDQAGAWHITDLGTLGGSSSTVTAMNNHGDVVGVSQVASGAYHGFWRSPGQQMIDLTSNQFRWNVIPLGIGDNDSLVVGFVVTERGAKESPVTVSKCAPLYPGDRCPWPFNRPTSYGSYGDDLRIRAVNSARVMAAALEVGIRDFRSFKITDGGVWRTVPVDHFEAVGIGSQDVVAGNWMCGQSPTGCHALLWLEKTNSKVELSPGRRNVTVSGMRGYFSAGKYMNNNVSNAVMWSYVQTVGVLSSSR